MKIKPFLTILVPLTMWLSLAACTPTPPPANQEVKTDATLVEASYAVSRSLVSLAETADAAHPATALEAPPSPASYGMGQLTSVDWSGPIEPLVRQIAKAAGYRMTVLGTPPAIPVLVSVYDRNVMLADVLRNVGYQGGRRAKVVVYPESRLIELRYAKN